ncbi:pyridoxal phosphate-dependent aminotransferase [Desulfogranum japonicum]|uniref:pyridoxal phosphate-dependent aminotransferase n=1 Tax=Desulfogranum japonicum TaxID=231447 RepID=UPI00040646B4|nr:pyridoxal phosphate-dependent aminotransferase [Desulfogranum japonicum]
MSSEIIQLADRVLQVAPSPTLAVNAKAKALKAAGADVLNFSVGEPDFQTPDHVCDAGKQAIDDGHTRYTPVPGVLELREAICARFKADHGWDYEPDQIQVCCGGKHGLYTSFQALLNPGDEVLIPAPYWVSYPPMVQLAGGTPVIVPLDEKRDFDLNPDTLASYVTDKTRAIVLNSPSNPTGAVFSAEALAAVAEIIRKHKLLVISDDMYETLIFMEGKLPHILDIAPDLKEQTLILNGVSKSFSMTGWRIGYSAGPLHLIKAMNKIQSQSTSNPAAPSQYAALAALTGPQDFTKMMMKSFRPRRRFIVDSFQAMKGVSCVEPAGAFYVFPNFSSYYGKKSKNGEITGSVSLADYLLDEALVATVPGAAFGSDEFIRFSFATSMEIIHEGMERVTKALEELK